MSDRTIITRYAKALYQAAVEASLLATVTKDITAAHTIFLSNPDLNNFLRSPYIKRAEKLKLLRESFGGQFSDLVLNFWQLLLEKNRQELITAIFPVFEEIRLKEALIYHASVTYASAGAVADNQKIEEFIRTRAQLPDESTVVTESKINPDLIGGFILQVDNKYFDYSLRGQLDRLKNEI